MNSLTELRVKRPRSCVTLTIAFAFRDDEAFALLRKVLRVFDNASFTVKHRVNLTDGRRVMEASLSFESFLTARYCLISLAHQALGIDVLEIDSPDMDEIWPKGPPVVPCIPSDLDDDDSDTWSVQSDATVTPPADRRKYSPAYEELD